MRKLVASIVMALILIAAPANALAAMVEYSPVVIAGSHVIDGAEDLKSLNNTFVLTAKDGAPLPEGAKGGKLKIVVPANSDFSFGPIQFEKPGNYEYVVTRKTEPSKTLELDKSVYHVYVSVFTDGSSVMVLEKDGMEAKPKKIEYKDKLNKPTTKERRKSIDTGETMQLYALAAMFSAAFLVLLAARRKENE